MRRPSRERLRELPQVDSVALLERCLTDAVLLDMVVAAKADRPAV
jgi:hypothetical protein